MRSLKLPLFFIILIGTGSINAAPQNRKLIANPPAAAVGPSTITMGTLVLTRCGIAYCGSIPRALDPAGEVSGTIQIAFEYYPQKDPSKPPVGALVATEGGPGYPTTGSRAYYLGLFEPLMQQRSLLLVDNRGTGGSGAITCTPLQVQSPYTQAAIQACGAQLGNTSDLYGTGLAADDLAAVIEALQLAPVDLYGDSYGVFQPGIRGPASVAAAVRGARFGIRRHGL